MKVAIASRIHPASVGGLAAYQRELASGLQSLFRINGQFLSVHEGPQRIAKSAGGQAGTEEVLQAGMVLSNEPGYYKAGAFGIRIENLLLITPVDPPPSGAAVGPLPGPARRSLWRRLPCV